MKQVGVKIETVVTCAIDTRRRTQMQTLMARVGAIMIYIYWTQMTRLMGGGKGKGENQRSSRKVKTNPNGRKQNLSSKKTSKTWGVHLYLLLYLFSLLDPGLNRRLFWSAILYSKALYFCSKERGSRKDFWGAINKDTQEQPSVLYWPTCPLTGYQLLMGHCSWSD